jgi:hypothetical protein
LTALGSSGSTTPPRLETLTCPKCRETMRLARIEPEGPGKDLRMYECKCGHSESKNVTYK